MIRGLIYLALFLLIMGACWLSTYCERYVRGHVERALDEPIEPLEGCPVARAEEILAEHERLRDWESAHWWDG